MAVCPEHLIRLLHGRDDLLVDHLEMSRGVAAVALLLFFEFHVLIDALAVDLHQQRLADALAAARDGEVGDLVVVHNNLDLFERLYVKRHIRLYCVWISLTLYVKQRVLNIIGSCLRFLFTL